MVTSEKNGAVQDEYSQSQEGGPGRHENRQQRKWTSRNFDCLVVQQLVKVEPLLYFSILLVTCATAYFAPGGPT